MPTLSVVMATFNGSRFLREQLDSIARQTMLPDEMVICDDCSEDGTVAIAEAWAKSVTFPVRVHRNADRLGYRENFLAASKLSAGKLISWCDQDDLWGEDKLARCVAPFEDPTVVLAMHAFECFFPDGARFRVGPSKHAIKEPSSIGITEAVGPGFSMVFDRTLIEVTDHLGVRLPIDFGEPCFHDQWISFLAPAVGRVAFVPEVLAQYRQHDANVCGWERPSSRSALTASRERSTAELMSELVVHVEGAERRIALLEQIEEAGHPGATARLAIWRRSRSAGLRRASLYSIPRSAGRLVRLTANAAHGDYGARWRGGLGARSLVRDLAASIGMV